MQMTVACSILGLQYSNYIMSHTQGSLIIICQELIIPVTFIELDWNIGLSVENEIKGIQKLENNQIAISFSISIINWKGTQRNTNHEHQTNVYLLEKNKYNSVKNNEIYFTMKSQSCNYNINHKVN